MPIDIRAIVREYGLTDAEPSGEELVRILKNKGFKAKVKHINLRSLEKYPLPAIFKDKDEGYGVLLKLNPQDRKLLFFKPTQKQAQEATYEAFQQQTTGKLIILHPRILHEGIKFGFKWFLMKSCITKKLSAKSCWVHLSFNCSG